MSMTPSMAISPETADMAKLVRAGLDNRSQKALPSQYFYDDVGSALFEVITLLSEYGLARADERVIRGCAAELAASLRPPVAVAELGSGSGRKTRWVLEALARQRPVRYFPIDISNHALARCRHELGSLEGVEFSELALSYLDGIRAAAALRPPEGTFLVLFLGSTIGNFERSEAEEFLAEVQPVLRHGDALLLGADLMKPVDQLILAYNDPTGVTAAFNLNLLGRLNRELQADFDLRSFAHEIRFDTTERRIEMHLRSLKSQQATLPLAGFSCHFEEGETILTEKCHKYTFESLEEMAAHSGFAVERCWTDAEWPFTESLWRVRGSAAGPR